MKFMSSNYLSKTGAFGALLLLTAFTYPLIKQVSASKDQISPGWAKEVGAKRIPSGKTIFKVNNYGALNDGKTMDTKFIQKAIDACAANGGGIVTFDTGEYVTGSVFLKSGVTLLIDKNVKILGSQDINDYPIIKTRVAGIEMHWPAALINVLDQKNVAITGEGIIDGRGKPFWDKYWAMRKVYD